MKFFRKLSIRLFVLLILSNGLLAYGLIQITTLALSIKNDAGRFLSQGKVRPPFLHTILPFLGNPPNIEKAKELADEKNMEFIIAHGGVEQTTDNHLPRLVQLREIAFKNGKTFYPQHDEFRPSPHHKGGRPPPPPGWKEGQPMPPPPQIREAGVYQEHIYQIIDLGDEYTIVLFFKDHITSFMSTRDKVKIGVMFGAIILSLFFSIFLVTQMMSPLKSFIKGVRKVGHGRFQTRLGDFSTEEFSDLSKEFNNMVEKLDKMIEGRDYLLRAVNHELRSPLARLKIQSEMIEDEEQRRSIIEDLNELEELMENLLEVEKVQSGIELKNERFSLSELFDQLNRKFKKEGRLFELELPEEEIFFNGDQVKIRLLFKNLVENAFKYSDGKNVKLIATPLKSGVEVRVSDKGEGISEKDQQHIFDPFYRVDKVRTRKTGGLGLGLNLCLEIVRAHQGTISVNSKIGEGTTFKVAL